MNNKYRENLHMKTKQILNAKEIDLMEKEEGFKVINCEFIKTCDDGSYEYSVYVEWN